MYVCAAPRGKTTLSALNLPSIGWPEYDRDKITQSRCLAVASITLQYTDLLHRATSLSP